MERVVTGRVELSFAFFASISLENGPLFFPFDIHFSGEGIGAQRRFAGYQVQRGIFVEVKAFQPDIPGDLAFITQKLKETFTRANPLREGDALCIAVDFDREDYSKSSDGFWNCELLSSVNVTGGAA